MDKGNVVYTPGGYAPYIDLLREELVGARWAEEQEAHEAAAFQRDANANQQYNGGGTMTVQHTYTDQTFSGGAGGWQPPHGLRRDSHLFCKALMQEFLFIWLKFDGGSPIHSPSK